MPTNKVKGTNITQKDKYRAQMLDMFVTGVCFAAGFCLPGALQRGCPHEDEDIHGAFEEGLREAKQRDLLVCRSVRNNRTE